MSFSFITPLLSQTWSGAKLFKSNTESTFNSVVHLNDQVLAGGHFQGSIILGSDTLYSQSSSAGIIVNLDTNLIVNQFISFQSSQTCRIKKLVKANDGIYFAGEFKGALYTSIDTLNSFGNYDVFWGKLTESLEVESIHQIKGLGSDIINDLYYYDQSFYLIGTTSSPIVFTPYGFQENNQGVLDAFIYQYDLINQIESGRIIGGPGDDEGKGITVNQFGVHVLISYSDSMVTNTTLNSLAEHDLAIIKLTDDYGFNWSKSVGSYEDDHGMDIALDGEGNCYFTGDFRSTVVLDGIGLTAYGSSDAILGQISSNGTLQWLNQIGWNGDDIGNAIHIKNKIIALGGSFAGSAMINEDLTSTNSISNAYIAFYRTDGRYWKTLYSVGANTNAKVLDLCWTDRMLFGVGQAKGSPSFANHNTYASNFSALINRIDYASIPYYDWSNESATPVDIVLSIEEFHALIDKQDDFQLFNNLGSLIYQPSSSSIQTISSGVYFMKTEYNKITRLLLLN